MSYATFRRRLEAAADLIRYSPAGRAAFPINARGVIYTCRVPSAAERALHLRHAGNDPSKMEPFHDDYRLCACHTWSPASFAPPSAP
jgi:hypothetical protein